ncbi:MAG: Transcriptional regulator, contains sigma factor-related N-terminal domain [Caldanaerobacter subterraneus]|jgi:central glycolytic genes regulator|uniref:Transcriptional regulator, contains sigma factor-related N-terminal domain n=2 Tax=Caldanaerobacter subterraneus TaxID=911092 RepID=Q8R963_CALS4|nr:MULTISPECIES: sugar-binding domain-containing protein [Caldanaerobacter]AAM24957.1 Transcriptional regulator, contains sigma factor-related N-terminal domain [Caldanaerobacter subterraneus subsp. tengcongensis MB4]KUK09503.1 MAG: Transcriptional regulator, contains sigma factor-related N-terminal domain [Caldanaerobacter subterraneus]MCS3915463.1 central glycolytic genes regulator [Caldanaerobacter subterraneus subsp. tengcongensis MB4]MDI3519075.1 central glycolytic s regulator [Caldanaerob
MKDIIALQQKIVPELIELLQKRYAIMRNIYFNQPIGRRALSHQLNIGERIIRTEVSFLKSQGLIDINPMGMTVTKEGEELIESLKDFIHELKGLDNIEKVLEEKLKVEKVIVVPGNTEEDPMTKKELGKSAANYLREIIRYDSVIALTGGSTVLEVANGMPQLYAQSEIVVVPARGGLGREVEKQANTIASILAKKLGGTYKMLYVPDHLSKEAVESLMKEPDIKEVVDILKKADILIFGIGRADVMADRRNLPQSIKDFLKEKGAVAESLGYYFDKEGKIVYATPSIFLTIDDLKSVKHLIGVSGGKSKAEAILATCRSGNVKVLVTDEGAAFEILRMV